MFITLTLAGGQTPITINRALIISFVRYENAEGTTVYCTSFGGDAQSVFTVQETPEQIAVLLGD